MPPELALIRAVHLAAVVVWIGGVGFVATVLMPTIRRDWSSDEQMEVFARFARRFAWQARVTVALAGASGFWMTYRLGYLTERGFSLPLWLVAMAGVWLLFSYVLYVKAPLDRLLGRLGPGRPRTLASLEIVHRFLLALSLFTVAAAVVGLHA